MEDSNILSLSRLSFGMTVYHSCAGGGCDAVVLNGIRLVGDSFNEVEVELRYPDGDVCWVGISGLSTVPDFYNKFEAREFAEHMNVRLMKNEKIGIASIQTLVDYVLKFTDDVKDGISW